MLLAGSIGIDPPNAISTVAGPSSMVMYEYDDFETALAKARPEGGKRLGDYLARLQADLAVDAPVGLVGGDDGPGLVGWWHTEGTTRLYDLATEWTSGDVLLEWDWLGEYYWLHELEQWIYAETDRWLWLHPRHRWLCELDVDEVEPSEDAFLFSATGG